MWTSFVTSASNVDTGLRLCWSKLAQKVECGMVGMKSDRRQGPVLVYSMYIWLKSLDRTKDDQIRFVYCI